MLENLSVCVEIRILKAPKFSSGKLCYDPTVVGFSVMTFRHGSIESYPFFVCFLPKSTSKHTLDNIVILNLIEK